MSLPETRGGRRSTRTQFVMKIALSVVFGVIAFAATQIFDTHMPISTLVGVGVSLFIGGIAFVVQFLVDLAEHIAGLESRLGSVNEATKLIGLVEASAVRTETVIGLVRNAATISGGSPPLISVFAGNEIARLSGYLRELGQGGDVTYKDGEDRDWLLGLTRSASVSIDAVSLTAVDVEGPGFVDGGLWASELGVRYLVVQQEAIRRGVAIRRLFVVARAAFRNDPRFHDVLGGHAAEGITVKVLDISEKRRPLYAFYDFIVFDRVLCYETMLGPVRDAATPVIATRLVTQPVRVRERIVDFDDLWAAADDYVPPASALRTSEGKDHPDVRPQGSA
jgi:hypothetical protein